MIMDFGKKYINDSYSIMLYLNLNRLGRAEQDVNDCIVISKELAREVNYFRFQNAAFTVWCGIRWKRTAQSNLRIRELSLQQKMEQANEGID